jgi:uncharacterized OsmC-like protein
VPQPPPHAKLLDRYRAEPERARVSITVSTDLEGGLHCETTARGHAVAADEPRGLGGSDSAQSPVELLLSSLATCQAITYRIWAWQLGVALDRVEVEAVGEIDLRGFVGLDDEARAGYERIRMRIALHGPEAPERYRELAEAVDRHCPVLDVLSRPVPVERELELPSPPSGSGSQRVAGETVGG